MKVVVTGLDPSIRHQVWALHIGHSINKRMFPFNNIFISVTMELEDIWVCQQPIYIIDLQTHETYIPVILGHNDSAARNSCSSYAHFSCSSKNTELCSPPKHSLIPPALMSRRWHPCLTLLRFKDTSICRTWKMTYLTNNSHVIMTRS